MNIWFPPLFRKKYSWNQSFTCPLSLLWCATLTLLFFPSASLTPFHLSLLYAVDTPQPTPLSLSLTVVLHLGLAPISSPVIASSKNFLQKSRGALCAPLCSDDTDCSQMSWQHIHSAGGDKEVLPEARGQVEIGRRENERGNGKDREGGARGMQGESQN